MVVLEDRWRFFRSDRSELLMTLAAGDGVGLALRPLRRAERLRTRRTNCADENTRRLVCSSAPSGQSVHLTWPVSRMAARRDCAL